MAVTVSDVESWKDNGWTQLNSTKKGDLLDTAGSIIDGQLSERQSNFSTLQGDRDEAVELLAAHFYEIAEGGEAQSESSQGGNVSYNTVTGEWQNSLSGTRYGRILSDMYLRDRQGLGLVRTY